MQLEMSREGARHLVIFNRTYSVKLQLYSKMDQFVEAILTKIEKVIHYVLVQFLTQGVQLRRNTKQVQLQQYHLKDR